MAEKSWKESFFEEEISRKPYTSDADYASAYKYIIDKEGNKRYRTIYSKDEIINQIKKVLEGIDKDESENGWWADRDGVLFGVDKLNTIVRILEDNL